MRAGLAFVLALAVLWCGYWFVGARIVSQRTEAAFAQAAARGLVAEHDGLTVLGFPNRFDLTIDGPHLFDPRSGYGWQAPFVQIFALTYRPWHIIAAFAPEQQILTPFGELTLTAGKLQASARARPSTALPLDSVTLIGTDLGITVGPGWGATAQELRFATRDLDGAGLHHEIGLEIGDLAPDPSIMARLPDMPPVLDHIRLDADLDFAAPIDRFALRAMPELTGVTLTEALVVWGKISAHASGTLAPDAAGFASGSLTLRLVNWRQALAAAVSADLVAADTAETWSRMLAALARSSGDADTITLPLSLSGGSIRFGFLPLGAAPRWP